MAAPTLANVRVALACGLLALACGGHAHDDALPDGLTCPPGSTVTHASFGRAFSDRYCVSCHASTLKDAARNGAPSDHDLDTLEAIRAIPAGHLFARAGAFGSVVNTAMPPREPRPTVDERRQLAEWLACGLP